MTLKLPTDGCPECVQVSKGAPVHPYDVQVRGVMVDAWYECPACGYAWWTGWTVDALSLPCPGCELCEQEGAA